MSATKSSVKFRVHLGIFSLLDLAVAARHSASVLNDDSANTSTHEQ